MRFRHLAAVAAAFISSSGFCAINANTGFYVGGEFDLDHFERPSGAAIGDNIFSLPGGLLRPLIGYRYNDYLAVEGGYNDIVNENRGAHNIWGPDALRIYTYDLSAKGIYPFESGFSVFAKGGLAYTHQYVYNLVFVSDTTPAANSPTNRIQPLIGVGVSYNITKNLATDIAASYYFRSGSIGSITLLGLGVAYTFGDL